MFARLREMLDRWLEASEGIARQLSEWGLPLPETRRAPRCAPGYLPAELSSAQRVHRGRLPVPRARFRSSMLLPSMHRVLLWCFVAMGRVEYHGPRVGIASFLRFFVTSRHIAR
jgi:hypothetical protein